MLVRNLLVLLAVLAASVSLTLAQSAQTPTDICAAAAKDEPATRTYAQPEQVLEAGVDYRAIFCTESGAVYVDLFEKYAPLTVNSFVFLAQNGYYNNTTFHRVLENFMAQGGDPTGTGTGGPGYRFDDEIVGFLTFDREGLLAMANAGAGTNGSQFFITTAETPWLDYRHTIFGDVLEGLDVVKALRLRDPQTNPAEAGARLDTVVIVTDPASVVSTFAETLPAVGEAAFKEGLERSVADLPPALKLGERAGMFTSAQVAASAPEALRADYEAFLRENNHAFRAAQEVVVAACTGEYPYDLLGYTVDAFATAADARAVYESAFLQQLNAAEGYEKVEEGANYVAYNKPTESCTGAASGFGRVYTLRGRYLVSVSGIFANEVLAQIPLEMLYIQRIAPIFESELKEAYRSELR